jgi:hypothetical protein
MGKKNRAPHASLSRAIAMAEPRFTPLEMERARALNPFSAYRRARKLAAKPAKA